MSFFKRLFGGERGRDDVDRAARPAYRPEDFHGGAHGGGDRAIADAKPELLNHLRELGARSAVIAYDGGNDEGAVTAIHISRSPLGADPREFSGDLPQAEPVELDWDSYDSGEPGLLDYAMDVVADRWGSFAGPFFVAGRLVVDVDTGTIARHDDMWSTDDEPELEDEDEEGWDEGPPPRPPDAHDVEEV